MKKTLTLIIAIAILATAAFAGCGNSATGKDTITLSAQEMIEKIVSDCGEEVLGFTMEEAVTADKSQSYLGLSEDDFAKYVDSAFMSYGAFTTSASLFAVIKAKDAASAKSVKDLVASGFNSMRWVCVLPETSVVIESGSYVLLAVSSQASVDKVVEIFSEQAGDNIGEEKVFYTRPTN